MPRSDVKDAQGLLASLALSRQSFELTIKLLADVRWLYARDPNPHFVYGQAQASKGNTEEAVAALEHAARIAPTDAQSHNLMGMIMTEAQRPQVGEHHYRQAMKLIATPSPINASSGIISGIITGTANVYSSTVTVADGHGASFSQSFTWTVTVLSLTNPGTQNDAVGDKMSLSTISASGLPSGDTWSYAATGLPSGLSIKASTGVISGTITGSANTYSVTVTASDGDGASVSVTFTFNVT